MTDLIEDTTTRATYFDTMLLSGALTEMDVATYDMVNKVHRVTRGTTYPRFEILTSELDLD
jgi:hypothetical protein